MVASTASPAPSTPVAQLTERARDWIDLVLDPRPNRAVAFQLNDATIGVLHPDGLLEVPVPTPVCAVLVEEGLAQPHTACSGADWVAVHVRSSDNVDAAVLLLRLSYLYRRLLRSQDALSLRRIRIELDQYDLPDALAALYDAMIAKRDAGSSAPSGRSTSV